MSKPKSNAKRKRRRRRPVQLTDEERVTMMLAVAAAEQSKLARKERWERTLTECMAGDCAPPPKRFGADLDRWELLELLRINAGRALPLPALPYSAFEAMHLTRFAMLDEAT